MALALTRLFFFLVKWKLLTVKLKLFFLLKRHFYLIFLLLFFWRLTKIKSWYLPIIKIHNYFSQYFYFIGRAFLSTYNPVNVSNFGLRHTAQIQTEFVGMFTDSLIHGGGQAVLGQLDQRADSCQKAAKTPKVNKGCKQERPKKAFGCSPVSLWRSFRHSRRKSLLHTHNSWPPEIHALSHSSTRMHWHTHTHRNTQYFITTLQKNIQMFFYK